MNEEKIREELQELEAILENDDGMTDEQFYLVTVKVLDLRYQLRLIINGEPKKENDDEYYSDPWDTPTEGHWEEDGYYV